MARPIDGDRWEDPTSVFIPYTRSERTVRTPAQVGQARTVGQVLALLRDDRVDDPTGALAALLLTLVTVAEIDVNATAATTRAQVCAMTVNSDARITDPVICASEADLVAMLRSLTDDIAIAGPIAKVLYARYDQSTSSLHRGLTQLASAEAMMASLAGEPGTEPQRQPQAARRRPPAAAIEIDDDDLTDDSSASGSSLARSAIVFAVVALSVAVVGSIALNAARAHGEPITPTAVLTSQSAATPIASASPTLPNSATNSATSAVRGGATFDKSASVGDSTVVVLRERLAALDRARSESFANPQRANLAAVDAANSPAIAQDSDLIDRLRSGNAHVQGGAQTIESVTPTSITDEVATLKVVDRQAAYQVVHDESGEVLDRRPESPKRSWIVTLHRQHGQWLYYQAVAAEPQQTGAVLPQ